MIKSHHVIRFCGAGLVLLCGGVLGACGSNDQAPAAAPATVTGPSTSTTPTAATTPTTVSIAPPATVAPTTAPATTTEPADAPVAIVGVYEGVVFYPACGNEVLEHEGIMWYPVVDVGFEPLDPELRPRVEEISAVDREPSPVVGVNGLARVVAPGPGDDVGTLVVWADGVSRWVSDSRDLDVWMIDDEITYNWVC